MYKLIFFLTLLIIPTSSVFSQDSTLVRIRVDVDSVGISLNGQSLEVDSYDNLLSTNSWFILNLPIDTYQISILPKNYNPVDTTIVLTKGQIYVLDLKFIEVTYEDTTIIFTTIPENIEVVKLSLLSDPDSSSIIFSQNQLLEITPLELYIKPGEYPFQVSKDGYEPLRSNLVLEPDKPMSALFNLSTVEPPKVTAESLGLSYMFQQPMLDKKQAANLRKKYNSLAESFAIFPLAQGILARLVVDKSQRGKADGLIISGVCLTAGAYFLGKIFSKRKQNYIIAENERRAQNNLMVSDNNQMVDQQVREENSARMKSWLRENKNRGKVEITVEEPISP